MCAIPQPSGKYPIVSLDDAGGIPAGLKTVESVLNTGVMTCAGKTLSELLADWEPLRKPRMTALAKYAALVTSADTGTIVDSSKLG